MNSFLAIYDFFRLISLDPDQERQNLDANDLKKVDFEKSSDH